MKIVDDVDVKVSCCSDNSPGGNNRGRQPKLLLCQPCLAQINLIS